MTSDFQSEPSRNSTVLTSEAVSMRSSARASCGAVVVVVAPAALLFFLRGNLALLDVNLALLFLHEQVYQQNLLLVDLHADVFGDVWD